MSKIIAIQGSLHRALLQGVGCKDYQQEEELLERVDGILKASGIERWAVLAHNLWAA